MPTAVLHNRRRRRREILSVSQRWRFWRDTPGPGCMVCL